ncbi:coatomer subunit beta'-1-like isoform X2 [Pyrus x bretschneideri]|uniref:coatomer subunit beta'-1-like isoform X2 n=1 Tax=Pyrus x bretschneideri TaxID=225117 RepID=UPI00202FB7FE|nr:coatomer subunit beta'-1-like isoform X2 [Pyrus x bretschneideri]XP_048444069.1 coatomer subunit beta'-1-like isoform X2 [Pyrus x bretschneideri]
MARSYLPSKVSEIVSIWRNDLNKVNKKAAESLADPQVCPNLFEDWGIHPPVDDFWSLKWVHVVFNVLVLVCSALRCFVILIFQCWVSTPHFTSSNSIEVGSADCVCN